MIPRTTPLSALPKRKVALHRCHYPPPLRKSLRTEDGFIDVEWPPEELKAYREDVLKHPQITRFTLV